MFKLPSRKAAKSHTLLRRLLFSLYYCIRLQVGMGPEMLITHIIETLTIIQQNIPRAIVSLMNVLHVEIERQVDREHPTCRDLHTLYRLVALNCILDSFSAGSANVKVMNLSPTLKWPPSRTR